MIWDACNGKCLITKLNGLIFRLVESQEQIATLAYVDTLAEQALLEDMLEKAKPPYPEGCADLHYLLRTPFRYPPLKWGSRFGRIHEPGIFYGSLKIRTTLAEAAYYRYVFWYSMSAKPIKDHIRTEHTLFSVKYRTCKGIRLQQPPFDAYRQELRHPKRYTSCQALGTAMRKAGVEVFEYFSARDTFDGLCLGVFTPQGFAEKHPHEMRQWLCEINAREVSFKQMDKSGVHVFRLDQFLLEGDLPVPA